MAVSTEGAEKASLEKPKNEETKAKTNRRLAQLSLAAQFTHAATARQYIELYEKMLKRPLIT